MPTLTRAIPNLPAANVQAAMAFACEHMGFAVTGDYGDYGLVARDGAEVHFWQCADPQIAECSSAYFIVEDVDGLFGEVAPRAGDHVVVALGDQPYGMREFIVKDPDGNLWKFGEPVREAA